MKWNTLNTINTATASPTHAFSDADNALHMLQQPHTPKLTTLSLHSRAYALPTSPCWWKGVENVQPPGLQLPGLRASSHQHSQEKSHSQGHRQPTGLLWLQPPLLPVHAHVLDLLVPPWQASLGDNGAWDDSITGFFQSCFNSQPPQGSQGPEVCITTAYEICSVISLLLYYRLKKERRENAENFISNCTNFPRNSCKSCYLFIPYSRHNIK